MQNLRVTLVQANQVWENKTANFKNYSRLLEGISTDLILLPEMFNTGFSMNAADLAEDFDASASIDWLKQESRQRNAAFYTSLMVRDRGNYYNRGVFVEPSGAVHYYDKRKTFSLAGEDTVFSRGVQERIVHYSGFNFQLQICYDLRFPEIGRNRLDSNQFPVFDVMLFVANWPEKRTEHWKALLKARAIENQCYVIGVNRVGKDGKELNYSGDSLLIDALGDAQGCLPEKEGAVTFVIKKDELNKIREMLPFLRDMQG